MTGDGRTWLMGAHGNRFGPLSGATWDPFQKAQQNSYK